MKIFAILAICALCGMTKAFNEYHCKYEICGALTSTYSDCRHCLFECYGKLGDRFDLHSQHNNCAERYPQEHASHHSQNNNSNAGGNTNSNNSGSTGSSNSNSNSNNNGNTNGSGSSNT